MNHSFGRNKKTLIVFLIAALFCASAEMVLACEQAKNVILMISDGQGFNVIKATDYYTGKKAIHEIFPHKFAMQTNSAGKRGGYVGTPYSPDMMAGNFNYAKTGATDSSSAATAMYTGVKIYDSEVNYTPDRQVLTTFFEKAAKAGKSIGAVSSVEFTHATPTAVFGHNSSRNNYSAMALEAIYGSNPVNDLPNSSSNPLAGDNNNYNANNFYGNLKVVMGTGHPDYNADGQPQSPNYSYVGGAAAWADLQSGVNSWTLIQSKEEFQAYANGTKTADKLFGVAPNISTLQQSRSNASGNFDPTLTNQPTLVDMTKAALKTLGKNRKGFAVMIESGAIDWAGHANQLDRIIEEQIDFNNSVKAVVDYLNRNTNGNNWGNTLLIVTADHETGYLWGDGAGSFFDVNGNGVFDSGVDYAHITDNGKGNLPGAAFHSGDHSNSLVPLYAAGAGSGLFRKRVIGKDHNLRDIYDLDWTWNGNYVDNTSIYHVMNMAALAEPLGSNVKVEKTSIECSNSVCNSSLFIKNKSRAAIAAGELLIYLDKLTPGVDLSNASGTDAGTPYIRPAMTGALTHGQTITVPLQFSNPSNAKIHFKTEIYQN